MRKILVVEDEPAIGETIQYALETDGFSVALAKTGSDAMQILESGQVSLVVLDIGLPDVNGFELFRKIQQSYSVPTLFLTARGDEVDRIVGLELGADDYMVKPFSPRELSARVKAVLRRTGEKSTASGSQGSRTDTPFIVDRDKHRITYFGKPLTLTRYEFRLLERLISRPGQVFTRDQLMEQVWDDPAASTDRTVDSHVKTIRAHLREVRPDLEAIITHRGVGYSLREEW